MKRVAQGARSGTANDFKKFRNENSKELDPNGKVCLRKALERFLVDTAQIADFAPFSTPYSSPDASPTSVFGASSGRMRSFMKGAPVVGQEHSFESLFCFVKERVQRLEKSVSPFGASRKPRSEIKERPEQPITGENTRDSLQEKDSSNTITELEENLREAARRIITLDQSLKLCAREKELAVHESEQVRKLYENQTAQLVQEFEALRKRNEALEAKVAHAESELSRERQENQGRVEKLWMRKEVLEAKVTHAENELSRERQENQGKIENLLDLLHQEEEINREMRARFKNKVEEDALENRRLKHLIEEQSKMWMNLAKQYEGNMQKQEFAIARLSHYLRLGEQNLSTMQLNTLGMDLGNLGQLRSFNTEKDYTNSTETTKSKGPTFGSNFMTRMFSKTGLQNPSCNSNFSHGLPNLSPLSSLKNGWTAFIPMVVVLLAFGSIFLKSYLGNPNL